MPYLVAIGSRFEKLLSYLRSAPLNLSCCKVWCNLCIKFYVDIRFGFEGNALVMQFPQQIKDSLNKVVPTLQSFKTLIVCFNCKTSKLIQLINQSIWS